MSFLRRQESSFYQSRLSYKSSL
ncbi:MAG: hypothetical protein ACD_3C00006G0021, partial [uncultured bacterium (gcode 4)]